VRGDAVIQQSRNEADKTSSVSIPVINFVDRALETERRLTDSESYRVEREVAHLKELHGLEIKFLNYKHEVDSIETKRRLDELNHAHAQNAIDKGGFVPYSLYNQFVDGNQKWREEVNKTLSMTAGKSSQNVLIIGFIFAALQILLHFWK
jgi:hypothetical protein